MTFYDLSHTIEHGTITYKGLPGPIICDYLSREESRSRYAPGTEFQIGKIEMVANTGTYVDSPFHRYADGKDLAQLNLEKLADLPAQIVRIEQSGQVAITPDYFQQIDVVGRAVLVQTNWTQHWGSETYFEGHPFLTEESALYLKQAGAVLVGIDSHNIDDTRGNTRPVHTILLGAEIPIVEHLTGLDQLPSSPFSFFAVPPKISGFGTFPVRAFAICKHDHS